MANKRVHKNGFILSDYIQIGHHQQLFTRESSYCFQRVLAIAIVSVCLSIRPSHGWISQKRCKLGSPNLYRRLPGRL